MIVFIFTVENPSKWQKIAYGLAQTKLYGENWLTLKNLENQSKTGQNALQKSKEKIFVFVGHADKSSYGGNDMGDLQYSPKNLLKK